MNDVGPGSLLVARYRLAEQLPSDLADVTAWSAHDQILDRPVRMSVLSGPHVAEALDSARRAALVTDPRLTRVLDVGAENGLAYVVTEPFVGITLSDVVASGIVDPQQARAVVGEAAAALEVARRRGVHHLALRPDAVRVDGNQVVVTGLGLDAGLSGQDQQDAHATSRADAVGLVALLYYTMTARWAGKDLDVPWISPDSIHPLPAQRDGAGVVSLAALVRDVPADLVALCERTFGSEDPAAPEGAGTGPQSPAELVAELEPWGQVSVVAALPSFVQPQPAGEAGVNRQSVLNAFGAGASAPPGTPPPAPPVRRPTTGRIHRAPEPATYGVDALGGAPTGPVTAPVVEPVGTATYGAVPGPAPVAYDPHGTVPPAPVPPVPSGSPAGPPAPGGPPPEDGRRGPRRFNPTALVLALVAIGVIAGVVWAMGNVIRGFDPPLQAEENPTVTQPTDDDTEAAEGGEETEEPSPEPTPEVRPEIASGRALDPEGDAASSQNDGEHPELVERAFDSQPETFWFTRRYNTPQFGGLKSGIGYAIILEQEAPVSRIVLDTNVNGGNVEVRRTSADAPTEGDVLASSSMSEQTELTFSEPVVGETFVLWFTELPLNPQGEYRVEINEIQVS